MSVTPYEFNLDAKSDIRDVWKHYKDAEHAFKYLDCRLIEVDMEQDDDIVAQTCTTFRDLDMTYRRHLHWTQLTSDALAISLAVVCSVRIKGPLLWMYLIGPSGCVSGDTKVNINRAGNGKRCTVKYLHEMTQGGTASGKQWSPIISTYIQGRAEDGTLRKFLVAGTFFTGIKPVWRLTTASGYSVELTEDHEVLTEKGWSPLKNLSVATDTVCVRGDQKVEGPEKPKKSYRYLSGLLYHPLAIQREDRYRTKGWYKVPTHRLVMEANLNGLTLEEYLHQMRTNPHHGLKCLDRTVQVHHKDDNHLNNTLGNLEVVTPKEHYGERHAFVSNVLYKSRFEGIKEITYVGPKETYDISVVEPHNFVAGGVVVHNCGKSTICDSISSDKVHVKRVNSFTGFHSGYKTGDDDRPDVSLISKLPGKALVVPDFTSVLAMSPQTQEKIYGEMRNIYDGISSMHYGNDTDREYNKITFPTVAGVTHEIHGLRKSALGERFLKVDMTDQSQRRNIISRNIQNVIGSALGSLEDTESFDAVDELNPFMREIKAHTLGFLQHLFRKIAGGMKIKFPDWFAAKLEALAMIVAASRAEAKRNSGPDRDLVYRPMQEIGSHPAGQLAKLSVALCVVFDCDPNEEILRLVQKVAIDTSYGFPLDVIRVLGQNPEGLTVEQIASKTRLAPTSVRKICDDLREMEIVYRKYHETASGAVGREAHILHLSTQLQSCWEEIYGKPAPKPQQPVTEFRTLVKGGALASSN